MYCNIPLSAWEIEIPWFWLLNFAKQKFIEVDYACVTSSSDREKCLKAYEKFRDAKSSSRMELLTFLIASMCDDWNTLSGSWKNVYSTHRISRLDE